MTQWAAIIADTNPTHGTLVFLVFCVYSPYVKVKFWKASSPASIEPKNRKAKANIEVSHAGSTIWLKNHSPLPLQEYCMEYVAVSPSPLSSFSPFSPSLHPQGAGLTFQGLRGKGRGKKTGLASGWKERERGREFHQFQNSTKSHCGWLHLYWTCLAF